MSDIGIGDPEEPQSGRIGHGDPTLGIETQHRDVQALDDPCDVVGRVDHGTLFSAHGGGQTQPSTASLEHIARYRDHFVIARPGANILYLIVLD
jgi:hypothetical protein